MLLVQEQSLEIRGCIVRVKASESAGGFDVTGDGAGLEGRAGLSLPAQLANQVGLTRALRQAVSGVRSWRDHHPGVVARDLAVMLVDGGECVSDLAPRDPVLLASTPLSAPRRSRPLGEGSRRSPMTSWR